MLILSSRGRCLNRLCLNRLLQYLFDFAIIKSMHIISKRRLRDFWTIHPGSTNALLHWHTTLARAQAPDFSALKAVFNTVDWVSGYVVFDVGGDKYRVIADVVFRSQTVFIKHIFTHKEYDSWKP